MEKVPWPNLAYSESETTRLKLDTCWWSMEKVPWPHMDLCMKFGERALHRQGVYGEGTMAQSDLRIPTVPMGVFCFPMALSFLDSFLMTIKGFDYIDLPSF